MQDTSHSAVNGHLEQIDSYIAKADRLPPAPVVLTQLLTLLRDPNADSGAVINILAYDPSLTATVLRLSNSAFFAGSEPAHDLYEAVMRLGFAQIYQLVAVVCGARSLALVRDGSGSHDTRLWTHSVSVALAAELLAKDFGAEPSVAFTAGLLHDIGKVVLTDALGPKYVKLAEEFDSQQPYPLETEKKLFGVEHCEVGGRLLARWKFPAPIVAAIWNHHDPVNARPHEKLAAYIYWGDIIASSIENCQPDKEPIAGEWTKVSGIVALSTEQLGKYTGQVFEQLKAVKVIMELNG
jgi:putative nucleotidyltransferase with HDIG domain